MDYEKLRNEILTNLTPLGLDDKLPAILSAIDQAAVHYEIKTACTDLSIPEDDVPQMVKMHIAALASQNRSKNTMATRLRILRTFFQAVRKPYNTVTSNDIRIYLWNYKSERGISASSEDQIRININAFYEWCVNEDYLERNPARKIGKIKFQVQERVPLTMLKLETLRSACRTPREKALIDFLYSTGCRVSECCDMLISDVNFDSQTVVIRHGKGDKRRISYLNAEAVISLRAYLQSRQDDCPYLFASERKPVHGLKPVGIQRIIRQISARTSIKVNVHPHLFRHTVATTALRSGMPVEQVQRFLGHSKVDTTLIYAKTDDSSVHENHRKYIA